MGAAADGPRLTLGAVSKVYSDGKRAVDAIDLDLRAGLLGLLGPNGAGKSSLMRLAATVTLPTSGSVHYDGVDVVARPQPLREDLGYLPQDVGVYPDLTAREFLRYLAAAKGLRARTAKARVDELLELVNLTQAAARRLGGFSGGMLRRVGIAQALLADPRVLIVDEPTAGLDPQERERVRALLSELATDRIVVLSTHIVADVESIASDIAIVSGGRLRRRGTVEGLLVELTDTVWEVLLPPDELAALRDVQGHTVSRVVRTAQGVRARVLASQRPHPDAVSRPPDLEDAYLAAVEHDPSGAEHGAAGPVTP